ncbi:MAG: 4-alpha-glucanotransferase, partial [Pseudomonadota bacterium]
MTALHRLAERFGLLLAHHEIDGTRRAAPPETLAACLAAMGVPAASEAEAADTFARVQAEDAARRLPLEDALDADAPGAWFGPHDRAWRLELETGAQLHGDPGAPLPGLPAGVHRLIAEDGEQTLLVAAPPRAPSPADLGAPRAWGVTAALYGLVAPRSFGRGDYEDLAQAAEGIAGLGADFLGINPIHDLGAAERGLSPYSPSSRTAFDPRHVAWDRTPEFAASPEAQQRLAQASERARQAARSEFGDADLRLDLGPPLLDALFAAHDGAPGLPPDRRAAFDAWLAQGGDARRRHALFEALSLVHGPDWRVWPTPLQDADGAEARAFAAAHPAALRRHAFAQWLAENQIAEAQTRARAAGMTFGLYLDIAVGVRPGGAETWGDRDAFARGVSLGAPPDMMNAQGQNWALAPFSPEGLRRAAYAPFRAMLAAAMDRAGLVRIDHVLQLERAYWIPDGLPGAYVRPPAKILEALVRLEAARRGVVVVGEDLGTVPEGFRDR